VIDSLLEQERQNDATPKCTAGEPTVVDMKPEVVVIPVSDMERAKVFYRSLGWRLDATPSGVVQFTFNQTEATDTGSVQVPIDLGRPFHQVNHARRIHPEEKTTCPFPPTKRFSN
jgi:catechol 2,3-dioxygenase-like lactoylglutathione lyase family enzyme